MKRIGNVLSYKSKVVVGVTMVAALCGSARAQSSVTLYGIISVGVEYVSNSGGHRLIGLINGPVQLPRFGLKGVEDIGGGTSVIFTLENGFSILNGTLGQGGRLFGRQAFVGLSNNRFGTLTFGRQYDEVTQNLYWSEAGNIFGSIGGRIGDSDNAFYTVRYNNSVRYKSVDYNGLSFSGQYAFSNATNFSNNRAYSIGASYIRDRLKLGVGFSQYNAPASPTNPTAAIDDSLYGYTSPFVKSPTGYGVALQRNLATGLSYDLGYFVATVGYSNVLFNYMDSTGLRVQNGEIFVYKNLTPFLMVGLDYIYTRGDYSGGRRVHYNQFDLGAIYSLSKRTDLFAMGIAQRAGGDATQAQIYATTASSSKSQYVLLTGMRHRF